MSSLYLDRHWWIIPLTYWTAVAVTIGLGVWAVLDAHAKWYGGM